MNTLNSTILQNKLFQVIDNVLQTGMPIEIERNGRKIMIAEVKSPQSITEKNITRHYNVSDLETDLKTLDKLA